MSTLNAHQLEAVARIQTAIANINKLRVSINEAAKANGIEVRPLSLHELGMTAHTLDGLLFDHESSESRKAA